MQTVPTIEHPTDRPNYTVLTVGAATIHYSYRTPVVFRAPSVGMVARNNVWGPTTGRHIAEAVGRPMPAPSARFRRMDEAEFTATLLAALAEEGDRLQALQHRYGNVEGAEMYDAEMGA